MWQTLESVSLALANADRREQPPWLSVISMLTPPDWVLEHDLGFRDRARAIVSVEGGTVAAMGRGALMSSDELVTSAILFCSGN
ncbi:MAG: hypothetical protein ABI949_00305 [Ilumatobacteraceae bacterium]